MTRNDRFRSGLDIENFESKAMLDENAAALAELGHSCIPGATLRDCDFKSILRPR